MVATPTFCPIIAPFSPPLGSGSDKIMRAGTQLYSAVARSQTKRWVPWHPMNPRHWDVSLFAMLCVCVCVFGTGEEEKEVNRDRGGLVSVIELRANRHTLRLCAWHYRP